MSRDINGTVLAEAQSAGNAPHYLLELALSSGAAYFVDDNATLSYDGHTYNPLGFRFDRILSSLTGKYDRVRLEMDVNHPTILAAARSSALQGCAVTIRKVFMGYTSSSLYGTTMFSGKLLSPQINDAQVDIEAISQLYGLNAEIPRRRIQTNCDYVFNGEQCLGGGAVTSTGISLDSTFDHIQDVNNSFIGFTDGMSITVSGTTHNDGVYDNITVGTPGLIDLQAGAIGVSELAGTAITITPSLAKQQTGTADAGSSASELVASARVEADDYWRYGTLTFNTGDNVGESRQIKESGSSSVTVIFPFPHPISSGDMYTISRGCNNTSSECKLKHDNFANYGGYVTIAKRK